MFTVNPKEQRDPSSGGLKERKTGGYERRPWLVGCCLLNSVKHKKIVKVYINGGGQFIHLCCLYSEAVLFLLRVISPEECPYYVNWQCSLTWLAHVQRLFKQPPYTHSPKHTHTYSHTKVHVHIEPARPIPLLQTIPTVFVNWYTLMLLNVEQTYNYSHKTHTHTLIQYMRISKAGNSAVNMRRLRN